MLCYSPVANLSSSKRVLGIDYGKKFTGVAITNGGIAPRPLKVSLQS